MSGMIKTKKDRRKNRRFSMKNKPIEKIARIHFVTYAEGLPFTETQLLLNDSISLYTKYQVVKHNYNFEKMKALESFSYMADLPNVPVTEQNNGHSDGYYNAFKPIICLEVYKFMDDNDILYYCDSSKDLQTGFKYSIDRLAETCFYSCPFIAGSFHGGLINSSYEGCCDREDVWKIIMPTVKFSEVISSPHVLASWFMFKKTARNTQFMNEWVYYSFFKHLNRQLITYHHTGDQSIFNILCNKYAMKSFYHPDVTHDENKDCNRVLEIVNKLSPRQFNDYFVSVSKEGEIHTKINNIHKKINLNHGSLNTEFPEQKMVVRYLTGSEKVLEIGGNIGRNSMVIASILKNGSLVTLESDTNTAKQLEENRNLNNFNFYIENSALSKRKLIQKEWDTMPSDTLQEGYNWVNTITFDELKNKYKIDFDTLVLDCEGAFYYILMDMPEILDNIRIIIMENDYNNIEHKEYVDSVMKKYNFYRVYSESGGWGPCFNNFFEVWRKN